MSQFEFVVMTENNIFAYKLFLQLNISDFIFYVKIATILRKDTPLFFSNTHLEVEVLQRPPF